MPFKKRGGLSGLLQPGILRFQQVRLVVSGLDDVELRPRLVTVRRDLLDDARYLGWLHRWNVEYVALGRHTHDWSARSELRLLAKPPPWLMVVHRDGEWTVWRVQGDALRALAQED